jgi:hypothetical protein
MRTRALLAALALPLALATGCGGDTSGTSSGAAKDPASGTATATAMASASASPTKPPQPKGPLCTDVWQPGSPLPGGYEGCYEGARLVKPNSRYCEFGKSLFTYADHYYAVPHGPVQKTAKVLLKDAGYRDVLLKCSG